MEHKTYLKPANLTQAAEMLGNTQGRALLFAGGTDILVYARKDERYRECTIVDIYGLPELAAIEEVGDWLAVGAGATHTAVHQNALVQQYAPILAQACGTVGSLQIRNHATLGGNIANASPAADTFSALAVLEAEVEVNRLGTLRRQPLTEVVTGPYKTSLTDRDIITKIFVKKLPQGSRANYEKLGRRKALAISRLTVAGGVRQSGNGEVDFFRLALGAVFPSPLVFPEIHAMLLGRVPQKEDVEAVAKALADKIPEIAGLRASTSYKQPVAFCLCRRLLFGLLWGEEP